MWQVLGFIGRYNRVDAKPYEVITALLEDFGWVLTPIDSDPLRTSDREH